MLNAYNERMTSCGLRSKKAMNREEVLSIKLPLKHSLSIFAITHLQSSGKVYALSSPVWLMPSWFITKSGDN